MLKFIVLSISAAFATTLVATTEVHAEDYALVVNAGNDFSGAGDEAKSAVRSIFLKQKAVWPNGVDAIPLGPEAADPAYVAFANSVLGMSPGDVEAHFLKLKQVKGETPPREVGSVRILMRTIGKQQGAFAAVLKSEIDPLPEGVRVLFEFSD